MEAVIQAPEKLIRLKGTGFRVCVRTGEEAADLSTPLRSGRDDKFVYEVGMFLHGKGEASPSHKFVISTGA
jgi:hypothetical protein